LAHKKTYSVFKQLVLSVGPLSLGYVALSYSGLPFQEWLRGIFDRNMLFVSFAFVSPYVGVLVFSYIDDNLDVRFSGKVNRTINLQSLLDALNDIVGYKSKRFSKAIRDFSGKTVSASDVFSQITKPDEQIAHIAGSIYKFVRLLCGGDNSIKVVLARIEKGLPVEYLQSLPNDKMPINDLLSPENASRTLFAEAARLKRPQFVSDIEMHNTETDQRYICFDPQDSGSIIVYPVVGENGSVGMAVSIKCDKRNVFNRKFKDDNHFFMECFLNRLALEDKLLFLRKTATFTYENSDDASSGKVSK